MISLDICLFAVSNVIVLLTTLHQHRSHKNGWRFENNIFKYTLRKHGFVLFCFSLKYHWHVFLVVSLIIIQCRFGHSLGPLSRYVKLRVAHVPGMLGKFSPPPRVSDPDMHHGTCVTHVPWCMPGSLAVPFSPMADKTFPASPAHAKPPILRIRYEAHC